MARRKITDKDPEEIVETKSALFQNTENNVETKIKKYEKTDLIECRSITSGGLYVTGNKTGNFYQWADYGDIESVEYQDLIYMIRGNKDAVYKPRFLILDENIVKESPTLEKLYKNLYKTKDLIQILELPNHEMERAIDNLPLGAVEALKSLAATRIENRAIDSIRKIETLDRIFGTEFRNFPTT